MGVHAVARPVVHAVAHPVAHAVGYNDLAEISPYSYQYGVADEYSGAAFQQTETDDGTGLREGSSTSTTTLIMRMATSPRSPTTALLPTLMSLSESATVLSAMPSPGPLLSPIPLLSLVPLLSPIPLLSLVPLLSHLTALSAMVSALVTVVPSSDKGQQEYLCIYQQ